MEATSDHVGGTPADQVAAIHPLAESIYLAAARSLGLLKQVQSELGLFLSVLSTTETHIPHLPRDSAQDAEISKTLKACHQVLLDLQQFKESSDASQISDLEARLSACIIDLTSLNTDLMKFSQENLDCKLQAFIDEIQTGVRDSKIVVNALSGPSTKDGPEWNLLQQELVTVAGISPALIKEDRMFIVAKLRSAFPPHENSPSPRSAQRASTQRHASFSIFSSDGHFNKKVVPTSNFPILLPTQASVKYSSKQVSPKRSFAMRVKAQSDPCAMKNALPKDNFPVRVATFSEAQKQTMQQPQYNPSVKKPSEARKLFYQIRHGQHDFFYHISSGSFPLVKQCLEKGAEINAVHENGCTPLEMAVSYGYEEIVCLLINWGADMNHFSFGQPTALGRAAAIGHGRLVQLLLENGAQVNRGGQKPLSKAAETGWEDIVQVLLACGAGIDLVDVNGYTALGNAVKNGRVAVVQLLLDNGANVSKSLNGEGRQPLYDAVEMGYVNMVRLLLAYKADARVKTRQGATALSLAVSMNRKDVLGVFQDFGYSAESTGFVAVQYA
ncbi:hypothetical protein N7474_009993 [Penicillium riverlandense]|uniref:uncharacterized protein n=1 Tax=Penicillium riverlandense TaxID=1903569 RepID=UPI002549B206|nr:uncharacterized protein N7474_009993 [Penicillium riverlandense]KAJ5808724.1 hypothetical protein N7474_009993 [Penicillium riverlandense]